LEILHYFISPLVNRQNAFYSGQMSPKFTWQACALLAFSVLSFAEGHTDAIPTGAKVEWDPVLVGRSAVVAPTALNRTGWTAVADSYQTGSEPKNVLDGNLNTFWHTQYTPQIAALPHTLTIDMKGTYLVNGLSYLPRQDTSNNGNIGQHTIQLSLDGKNFGKPIASGTYVNDKSLKQTLFASKSARYVRLTAQSEAQGAGNPWSSAAEINVLSGPDPTLPRDKWTVSVDSAEPPPLFHSGANAIDGSTTTYWHTQYTGTSPGFPHTFTIDQGSVVSVSGLTYLPRPVSTGVNGRIGSYSIQYSSDGNSWSQATSGSWPDTADSKLAEFGPISARFFRLTALSEAGNRGPWTSAAEINLLDGSSKMADFQVTVDSEETAAAFGLGTHALDGDTSTIWHTQFTGATPGFPHTFTIDMQTTYSVHALTYTPRQDGTSNGNIGNHQIKVSTDGVNYVPVATGSFFDDPEAKLVNFPPTAVRYVQLIALSEAGNRGPWASAAEISVSFSSSYNAPSATLGKWGETIDFPIVPVAAVVLHDTGKVLTWSAYKANDFTGTSSGVTVTATYDPANGIVSQRTVTNTQHDMFCPGLAIDANGRPVVTGGNSAPKTSIYDPIADAWTGGANMQISRGYQAMATLSDGRIFTIGGSWSGGRGNKNGEIYSPSSNTWTLLPGCPVAPMLTGEDIYRADNHGWLFGWKNGYVFQAGPSKAMNWYGTTGTGSQNSAGLRASDGDAMNGNAVMYDAVNGKILTVGGAPKYQGNQATGNAHIITIGTPGATPSVTQIASMSYARSFGNSVVLPDGSVFIVGGQSWAEPFTDDTAIFYPELWNPTTQKFTVLAPMVNARTYHSVGLLLPDATVFTGGGGLCGACSVNHFDAQIYSPAYLFNTDGSLASRPKITSISTTSVKLGGSLTVASDSPITAFSLIRYGSATHTVNTDQRRIPLQFTGTQAGYKMSVPSDAGIALPGYWMLFAINAAGVPSVANTVLVHT